jgi:ParE toxin of type II toxin-antitoxin system, parDE
VPPQTAAVRFTANFEANLEQISTFWAEQGAPHAYSSLLDELGERVIGNLERHPRIGRKFFARAAQSVEVRERVTALLKRFGDVEVREYLSGDYLLLYCLVAKRAVRRPDLTVHLLAIRHHPQLSFDFDGFWQANRGEDI